MQEGALCRVTPGAPRARARSPSVSDRGAYRGIRVVLIDGKDYQALTPNAKLLLLTLKLMCGQAGICVIPALHFTLEEHTGIRSEDCVFVMRELEEHGWVKRERNIVWVIDGLKHEPGYAKGNPNHQKALLKYLDSLPHLQIVEDFRTYYSYLPGLGGAIVPPKEKVAPGKAPVPAKAKETWVQEAVVFWEETVGTVGHARMGKALKPSVVKHGWDKVKVALVAYVIEMQEQGKTCRVEWFAAEAQMRLGKPKARAARMTTQEQKARDELVAVNPETLAQLKAYKSGLNGKGEEWWNQMKQQASSRQRHPIAFAAEWLLENPKTT